MYIIESPVVGYFYISTFVKLKDECSITISQVWIQIIVKFDPTDGIQSAFKNKILHTFLYNVSCVNLNYNRSVSLSFVYQ